MMTILNSTVIYPTSPLNIQDYDSCVRVPSLFSFSLSPPSLSEPVADRHGYTMAILSTREPEEKHDAGRVADMSRFLAPLG